MEDWQQIQAMLASGAKSTRTTGNYALPLYLMVTASLMWGHLQIMHVIWMYNLIIIKISRGQKRGRTR